MKQYSENCVQENAANSEEWINNQIQDIETREANKMFFINLRSEEINCNVYNARIVEINDHKSTLTNHVEVSEMKTFLIF